MTEQGSYWSDRMSIVPSSTGNPLLVFEGYTDIDHIYKYYSQFSIDGFNKSTGEFQVSSTGRTTEEKPNKRNGQKQINEKTSNCQHSLRIKALEKDDKFVFLRNAEWLKKEEQYILVPKKEAIPKPPGTGCYIATCVYGSYDCPEVWTLRRFRDNVLASSFAGRTFIKTYYAISPVLVKRFGNTKQFRKFWKGVLDKLVELLRARGVEDTKYYD